VVIGRWKALKRSRRKSFPGDLAPACDGAAFGGNKDEGDQDHKGGGPRTYPGLNTPHNHAPRPSGSSNNASQMKDAEVVLQSPVYSDQQQDMIIRKAQVSRFVVSTVPTSKLIRPDK
jgi:hypothetical protein